MKTIIYIVFLNEVLKNCGVDLVDAAATNKKTVLLKNKPYEVFLKRPKRYLAFEKGATLTFQGNIAKSIIPPAPRGLNMITEYTLVYDLPADMKSFRKTATIPTLYTNNHQHRIIPFSYDYFYKIHPEYIDEHLVEGYNFPLIENMAQRKCFKKTFYDFNEKYSFQNICLKRFKRNRTLSLAKLSISQRMFYDFIEKWSLIHDFLPRYCFMRTLCESFELLLPYGQSMLHDIVHVFLGYTKPWAFHHKIFGRSLRRRHSIQECAELYGLYCRVSWLDFITKVVHG